MRSFYFTALAVIFSLLSGVAFADVVHLNTGGLVKGKVLEKDDKEVIISTPYGTIRIRMEDVDRIEEGGSMEEMYKKRLSELKDDDIEGHYKLGVWLRDMRMEEEAKKEFEKVIALDPNNADARSALGHIKQGDKWLTEEEIMSSQGFVKYNGEWVTKQDMEWINAGYIRYKDEWVKKEDLEMIKKGFRKLSGKWVHEDEYYAALGYTKYQGRWLPKEKCEEIERRKKEKNITEKIPDKKETKNETDKGIKTPAELDVWFLDFSIDRNGNGKADFDEDLEKMGFSAIKETICKSIVAELFVKFGRNRDGSKSSSFNCPIWFTCEKPEGTPGVDFNRIAIGGEDPEGRMRNAGWVGGTPDMSQTGTFRNEWLEDLSGNSGVFLQTIISETRGRGVSAFVNEIVYTTAHLIGLSVGLGKDKDGDSIMKDNATRYEFKQADKDYLAKMNVPKKGKDKPKE